MQYSVKYLLMTFAVTLCFAANAQTPPAAGDGGQAPATAGTGSTTPRQPAPVSTTIPQLGSLKPECQAAILNAQNACDGNSTSQSCREARKSSGEACMPEQKHKDDDGDEAAPQKKGGSAP